MCPVLLLDASTPTMAETTKLQLFVKVLGRPGWTGCSVFLCRLRGGSSWGCPPPRVGLKLPHTGLSRVRQPVGGVSIWEGDQIAS